MGFPLLRRTADLTRHLLGRATASWRDLPSCLIIGAQKGGTTSLHDILRRHPGIDASRPKEVHYFDNQYHRGPDWYRAAFGLRQPGRIGLESTPNYLVHPHVPARVHRDLPGVRLIAMLREPVARAYSGWQHMRRAGFEELSFADAVDRESARTDAAWERLLADRDAGRSLLFLHAYLRRSRYDEQLERWLALFPLQDLLIIRSEDFFTDPRTTVERCISWLGLSPWSPQDLGPRNAGGGYAALDPSLRERLRRYFAPHNQRLFHLIGRDLGW